MKQETNRGRAMKCDSELGNNALSIALRQLLK